MSNPWKVSAQFAAFVWFTSRKSEETAKDPKAATRFARDNWVAFLPYADEGMGQLLIKVGNPRERASRARHTPRSAHKTLTPNRPR